jgi:NitT/TauT family transport system permease protein
LSTVDDSPQTLAKPVAQHATPAEANPRRRRLIRIVLPPIAALVVGVALWQLIIIAFAIPAYMLPGPATVVSTLVHEAGTMVQPTLVTVEEAYLGFLIAAAVGFLSGLIMARWNLVERSLYPYLVLVQTIPIVAIAPLLVVWFGPGMATNMLVAAMIALFPVAANTLQGLKSTERNLVQLYQMAGASPRVQLFSLRVPAAAPYILTGLRIASGASVIGAIVGEFVAGIGGGAGGLGYVITESAVQLRTSELFVAVILASLVSLVLFGAITQLERRLLRRWHDSALRSDV